jgi:hypothetical protein
MAGFVTPHFTMSAKTKNATDPPEDSSRFRFETLAEAIPCQGLIERRRQIGVIADQ